MRKETNPEIKKEIVYGLRHIETGKLLGVNISSNHGSEFCGEYTVKLDHYNDVDQTIWYVGELYNAEYVRQYSTEWYNSNEQTPGHSYEPEELEVVEIQREIITIPHTVEIPSFLEYMRLEYEDRDPGHYKYIKEEYEKSPLSFGSSPYSLYDLSSLIEKGKWKPEEEEDNGSDNKSKTKKT
jgi:hypothetical protein